MSYLTVDAYDGLDTVKQFMKDKKYSFPVLMEDGYLSAADVNAFPTTWFLDPDGRKAFEKVGSSKRVQEEFTWRVEALLGNTPPCKSRFSVSLKVLQTKLERRLFTAALALATVAPVPGVFVATIVPKSKDFGSATPA